MSQLNLNMTPSFEASLVRFMKLRGCRSKSEAIRLAVEEGLRRQAERESSPDFSTWIGIAAKGQNPTPRFASEDDLWS